MNTLVVDANIVLSALMGRSLPILQDALERGLALMVPAMQWSEVGAVLRHLRPDLVDELLREAEELVEIFPIEAFVSFERRARERLSEAGQDDWPVLASAMALDGAIWSRDRDFFGVGVPVWTTQNIQFFDGEEIDAN